MQESNKTLNVAFHSIFRYVLMVFYPLITVTFTLMITYYIPTSYHEGTTDFLISLSYRDVDVNWNLTLKLCDESDDFNLFHRQLYLLM